jgi:outer membrane protein OmpA-like peptidoglycan-associated protein
MSHAVPIRALRPISVCRAGVIALALVGAAPAAQASPLIPDKPSVEVHLEVLRALKANAATTSFTAPIPEVTVVKQKKTPADSVSYAASGRKIPAEQPMVGQYGAVTSAANDAPFARGQSPALRLAEEAPKPVPKPAPIKKPASPKLAVVKTSPPKTTEAVVAPVAKTPPPTPVTDVKAEADLMKDLEKEAAKTASVTPVKTAVPAPVVVPPVAPAAKEVEVALPQLAPQIAPEITPLDLPPLPVPDAKEGGAAPVIPATMPVVKEEKPVADIPPLPPLVSATPPLAIPSPPAAAPEPKKPADMLVVEKKSGKELPALPPLPLPPEAKEAPLPASIEKRMDDLFVKQPEKQGVVSDTTVIIDPGAKAKQDAEAAKAKQQEADRQAQLATKEKQNAVPPDSPLVALPDSTLPPIPPTQIAPPPPAPELPDSLPLAAPASEADLPALLALPSLEAITGDGPEKSSLEIVEPSDGVMSKDIMTAKAPVPMQPFDAEEVLPKVTSGAPPKAEMEGLPPTLPPPPAAPVQLAKAEPPAAPKLLPAAEPEAKQEPEAPAATGTVSAVIVFDKDKTDLNEKGKTQLGELAPQIVKNNQQVRIVAYAAGTPEQASIARRVSLSRALQIRAFLIDKGVNQLNINVQALGNKVTSGEPERADIFVK